MKNTKKTKDIKNIRLLVDSETISLLKAIELKTGLKKNKVYLNTLLAGAKVEYARIQEQEQQEKTNNNEAI